MAKVYISSTYKDLIDERDAAAKAVRRLGHQTIAMEDYVATDNRPVDKCLADVRACQAYVGIIAWRYGFIPRGHNKSITHLEYEEAKKVGIPCLIFVLREDAPWSPTKMDNYVAKIKKFRKHLLNAHIVSPFSNPDELSALVSTAVSHAIGVEHYSKTKPKTSHQAPINPKTIVSADVDQPQIVPTLPHSKLETKNKLKLSQSSPVAQLDAERFLRAEQSKLQPIHLIIRFQPPSIYRISCYSGNPTLVDVRTISTKVKFPIQEWRANPIEVGKVAFLSYLTDQAREFLNEKKKHAILLTTDSMDTPFELLHDGKQFLCLSRPFSRRIEMAATPKRFEAAKSKTFRALVIGNPTGDLRNAEQEAAEVANLLEKFNVQVDKFIGRQNANINKVVTHLSLNSYHLIHFTGHGSLNKRDPRLSGLIFDEGMVISVSELERILRGPAFIFFSNCWAASVQQQKTRISFQGELIHNLSFAALKGGACGCLGPMWEIEDRTAKDFALAFYTCLLKGYRIGEAVLNARKKIRRRKTDCWASWALFGDPFIYPFDTNFGEP